MHVPALIRDLALIFVVSGIVSLVFRWIKQPLVLGYLLAGILVGPHVPFIPTLTDAANVQIWADLGVILMLFFLGLDFSYKSLLEVGQTAIITAITEVLLMIGVGIVTGSLLGWSQMESIFLGGVLAISSTTIIVKAFEELGVKREGFAKLVFAILIIEDLLAIVLLVGLSTIAASKGLVGRDLLVQVAKLVGMLLVVVPVGLWCVPLLLKFVGRQLDDEVRVTFYLGLCLLLVLVMTHFGFSAALGAFLMGTFMSDTAEGKHAEKFMRPIRDLFGAVFFTSVGILVDIWQVSDHIGLVLFISLVTIVGKVLSTIIGARISGQDRRTAMQAGLSLGQIGEFSFIIATLGVSLKVVRPGLYPLAVSVALVTTFATPYMIRIAVKKFA
jgi:monovalent cation:H+ antiporter-2, CPA2 family